MEPQLIKCLFGSLAVLFTSKFGINLDQSNICKSSSFNHRHLVKFVTSARPSACRAQFDTNSLEIGKAKGNYIVEQWVVPEDGLPAINSNIIDEQQRRGILEEEKNCTLSVALMTLDPIQFPTRTSARKILRKGSILISRKGSFNSTDSSFLEVSEDGVESSSDDDDDSDEASNAGNFIRIPAVEAITGRVGDRVFPGDVLSKQIRMANFHYPKEKGPSFDLPVVYEDDHVAIVNKPAGIPVFTHKGGYGDFTVRAALPRVLAEPQEGTGKGLRRPHPAHRIDRPTSGLLICAKTQPALASLADQFKNRKIEKSYVALLNGVPSEYREISKTLKPKESLDLIDEKWHTINFPIEEKEAISKWKATKICHSPFAKDEILTLVEVQPKTGRKHQIRRHMAWVLDCPLVGDRKYDDGSGYSRLFREYGLFLCAEQVKFEHPFYNSEYGRKEWLSRRLKPYSDCIREHKCEDGYTVMIEASVGVRPAKYDKFLEGTYDDDIILRKNEVIKQMS